MPKTEAKKEVSDVRLASNPPDLSSELCPTGLANQRVIVRISQVIRLNTTLITMHVTIGK
jgi:hypothetical protein